MNIFQSHLHIYHQHRNKDMQLLLHQNSTAQDYVNAWIDNHNKIYEQEKGSSSEKSSMRIHKLLQDEVLREYICNYLKRTYYRKTK